ncbi:hypothetical protein [Algoriphagus vanfongensis]|uniref:hypothetical protein n=1 Tax=Algoriphagus vanfongensis TaxID=426371 RepID=UPI0004186100|nr:hypothetical protein [Algoriphagus vanfongensis]
MKNKIHLFLMLGLLLLSFACQEEENPDPLVYWEQTGCADPWQTGPLETEEKLIKAVESYLKDKNVKNARVTSIFHDGREGVCLACTCTTGNRIYIAAPQNQKERLLNLGFQSID